MPTQTTQMMIEALTVALYGDFSARREQHVFSQALHGLVRLAKAELSAAVVN